MYFSKMFDVTFIDSGISDSYVNHCEYKVSFSYMTISTDSEGNHQALLHTARDNEGHGTAVVDQYCKCLKGISSNILMCRIDANVDSLINALEFIRDNIQTKIVQISLGLLQTNRLVDLQKVIQDIVCKNTLVISAYDNDGGLSFPAAFKETLSVDTALFRNGMSFIVQPNNVVDVLFPKRHYLLNTHINKALMQGSSFAASILSALLITDYKNTIWSKQLVIEFLQSLIGEHRPRLQNNREKIIGKAASSAVLFPFNKEVHSLIANQDLLPFTIKAVYDHQYSLSTGKNSSEYLKIHGNDIEVQRYEDLNWELDFDLFVLGHCEDLLFLSGIDYRNEILSLCKKYNKQVYSFSDISLEHPLEKMFPVSIDEMIDNTDTKLHISGLPIVSVLGTSSKQGKYYIQLGLRRELLRRNYNVGQIGTEPQSALFGIDYTIPLGYGVNETIKHETLIRLINSMLLQMELDNKDIILFGGQSMVIPYDKRNLAYYNIYQYTVLSSIQSDAFILVANTVDDIDYIIRTVRFLEAIDGAKVCAVVLSDICRNNISSQETIFQKAKDIEIATGIQVEILFSDKLFENLLTAIENTIFVE